MNIVVSPDNNYVMPCGVLLQSICENNLQEKINFHVIVDAYFLESNKEALGRIVRKYSCEIFFYYIDSSKLESQLPVNQNYQSSHITVASYYRLFIAQLLPESIEKVIYLDCDIIVNDSLKTLWDTDISGYGIGSIPDVLEGVMDNFIRLRYHPSLGYFNAGVLLMNLDYWRQNNCLSLCLEYAVQNYDQLKYHDQDILNYIFRESKLKLPLKYNVVGGFLMKELSFYYLEYGGQLEEALHNPAVIHFTNKKKPWIKGCLHPWRNKFFQYQAMTEWKGTALQKSGEKTTVRSIIATILRELKLVNQLPNPFREDLDLK